MKRTKPGNIPADVYIQFVRSLFNSVHTVLAGAWIHAFLAFLIFWKSGYLIYAEMAVLLLIVGPIVGWKLGWFTNGCIAGGVGLLLIILSTIIPGNEVWFGLAGLLVLPLVGYVYYRGHFDAKSQNPFVAPTSAADSKSPPAA